MSQGMAHTFNPIISVVDDGGSRVQGHHQLQNEYKISLGYISHNKQIKWKHNNRVKQKQ